MTFTGDEGLFPRDLKDLAFNRKLYDVVKFSTDIDIFSLADSGISLRRLARKTGIERRFLELVLGVLEHTGFMVTTGTGGKMKYYNTVLSRTYLSRNSPYYIGDSIFNDADTYAVLASYVSKGPPDGLIDGNFWTSEFVKTIGSKSLLGPLQATIESIDLSGRRRLLDVGGGHGLYSVFFTKKYPGLEAWVLDLPDVIDAASEYLFKFDASTRVHLISSAFEDFDGREKYDVVFASNYAGSRESLYDLVSRSKQLLEDRGWLIIRNYASDVKADPASALVSLDRYARRGRTGMSSMDFISALNVHDFTGIEELYRGDGVIIVQGIKLRL